MHDSAMIDGNLMTIVLVIVLFFMWKLELVATLLNLKAFPAKVPAELDSVLDEDQLARSQDYQRINARFDITQSTVTLMVLLTIWLLGGFEWLDKTAHRFTEHSIAVGLIYISACFLVQSLIQIPFSAYTTFVIEEKFGFNMATPGTFIIDRLKGLLLAIIIGLPLVTALLGIFHEVNHAWLWAWLVVTALQLLLAWLAPTYIMPLFNKFTPMEPGPLKDDIEALGKKCDFPLEEVFVMDGSKRSTKANAFFTGFGKHKKIALFDTLIDKSSREELGGIGGILDQAASCDQLLT